METGKKTLLGEISLSYVFYKRSGKWTGVFLRGSIS